jgi:hypothetical protein
MLAEDREIHACGALFGGGECVRIRATPPSPRCPFHAPRFRACESLLGPF